MIVWEKKQSVNVKEIDIQHQEFIELLNKLSEAIKEEKLKEEVETILKNLLDYTEKHFSTEEKYFDKFNYSGSQEHKAEHQRIKNEIANFLQRREKHESSIYKLYFELLDFLSDWLVNHLEDMDKKYTKCFNENGLY